MASLTPTSYLILGLLASRDWSAYELAEQIDKGVTEVWPRASRQLYNAPKHLVSEGLASAYRESAGGSRHRTVYSITPSGRAALRAWLTTEARPPALEFEGMLRVVLADQGTVQDLRRNLQGIIEHAERERERFQASARRIRETGGGTFPERERLFELSSEFMDGHFAHLADWAKWALDKTEDWDETTGPPQSSNTNRRPGVMAKARAGQARGAVDPPSGTDHRR